MNKEIKNLITELGSTDDKTRLNAVQSILSITDTKVDWVYEVWDGLLAKLTHENSYQRSIGIMVLCNLAKSDHENRMEAVLDRMLAHTKDEKFITSRQCILNIWKLAVANEQNREKVISHLEKRYRECTPEKHSNLLRLDIIQSLKSLSDEVGDPTVLQRAQVLINKESDTGLLKKCQAVLKTTA